MLDHGARFRIVRGIQYDHRIAIAAEKALQADKIRRARNPHQHRAGAALIDQPDAAEDEGPHDDLAHFRRTDHQRPHMGRVERQRGAALSSGSAASERVAASELAHLAGDLPDPMRGDRRLVLQAIAPNDVDRTLKHEPGGRVTLADVEHHIARGERARGAAGETLGGFDLPGIEYGEICSRRVSMILMRGLLARSGRLGRHRMSPPTVYARNAQKKS